MSDEIVYALDSGENKRESMTKEQVLAAIANAMTTGQVTGDYTAFIEMIKDQNTGDGIKMWKGTQAALLALTETDENTIYYVTDMSTLADLDAALTTLKQQLSNGDFKVGAAAAADNVTTNINGKAITSIFETDGTTVKKATHADSADEADNATNVTTNINGKAITSIFETDGTTVKKATEATTIKKYQHNIIIKWKNVSNVAVVAFTIISTDAEAYNISNFGYADWDYGTNEIPASGSMKRTGDALMLYSISRSPGSDLGVFKVMGVANDTNNYLTMYILQEDITAIQDTVIAL